jgi:hypothetical protein
MSNNYAQIREWKNLYDRIAQIPTIASGRIWMGRESNELQVGMTWIDCDFSFITHLHSFLLK